MRTFTQEIWCSLKSGELGKCSDPAFAPGFSVHLYIKRLTDVYLTVIFYSD